MTGRADAHQEQASWSGRLDERQRRRRRLEIRGRVEKMPAERTGAVLESNSGRAWLGAREDGRMSSAACARTVVDVVAGGFGVATAAEASRA